MHSPHVIFHVVHPTEYPLAPFVVAGDHGCVFSLVSITILLRRETSFGGLGASFVTAEERFAMTPKVLAEVAASSEDDL